MNAPPPADSPPREVRTAPFCMAAPHIANRRCARSALLNIENSAIDCTSSASLMSTRPPRSASSTRSYEQMPKRRTPTRRSTRPSRTLHAPLPRQTRTTRSALPHIRSSNSHEIRVHVLPSLVVLGVPPHVRGTDAPGADLELQLSAAFPRATLLVEKPISSAPPDVVRRVARALRERHAGPVGVGYMFRYLKGKNAQ